MSEIVHTSSPKAEVGPRKILLKDNHGCLLVPVLGRITPGTNAGDPTTLTTNVGSNTRPVYLQGGVLTAVDDSFITATTPIIFSTTNNQISHSTFNGNNPTSGGIYHIDTDDYGHISSKKLLTSTSGYVLAGDSNNKPVFIKLSSAYFEDKGASIQVSTASYAENANKALTASTALALSTGLTLGTIMGGTNNTVILKNFNGTEHLSLNITGENVTIEKTFNDKIFTYDIKAGAAAAKGVDDSLGLNSTSLNLPTSKAVADAISKAFAANDAMVFKGLITGTNASGEPTVSEGTLSPLSTSTTADIVSAGYTWRANVAFTLPAGYSITGNSINVEIGDLLIAVKDSNKDSAGKAKFTVALTNIDGAITGINLNLGSGISITNAGITAALNFSTIAHADQSNVTADSTKNLTALGEREYIKTIKRDSLGHAVGIEVGTIPVIGTGKYTIYVGTTTTTDAASGIQVGTIDVNTSDNNNNITIPVLSTKYGVAKLKSTTPLGNSTNAASEGTTTKVYPVQLDSSSNLAVHVPWQNNTNSIKTYLTTTTNSTTLVTTTNNNTYLNLTNNSNVEASVQITGTNGVIVTSTNLTLTIDASTIKTAASNAATTVKQTQLAILSASTKVYPILIPGTSTLTSGSNYDTKYVSGITISEKDSALNLGTGINLNINAVDNLTLGGNSITTVIKTVIKNALLSTSTDTSDLDYQIKQAIKDMITSETISNSTKNIDGLVFWDEN